MKSEFIRRNEVDRFVDWKFGGFAWRRESNCMEMRRKMSLAQRGDGEIKSEKWSSLTPLSLPPFYTLFTHFTWTFKWVEISSRAISFYATGKCDFFSFSFLSAFGKWAVNCGRDLLNKDLMKPPQMHAYIHMYMLRMRVPFEFETVIRHVEF